MENNIPLYLFSLHFRYREIFRRRQIIGPNAIPREGERVLQNRARPQTTTGHNKSSVFAARCIWRLAQATNPTNAAHLAHRQVLTRMPVSAMTKYALLALSRARIVVRFLRK